MEAKEAYRGRLIDHLHFVVRDIEASRKFYTAVFAALDIPMTASAPDFFTADELFVSSKESRASEGELTGRTHLAFQAFDRAMVDRFYKAALQAGGRDNGKPGERKKYHPGYYGAFVIDPDGNNIEAVFHGDATRSSRAVKVSWD